MESAIVNGVQVLVGEHVGFKSDIEQTGKIVAIQKDFMGRTELVLENEYGFEGEYLQGINHTNILSSECW